MSGIVARKVYVISDLHLGGEYSKTSKGRGFRINTHVSELTEFVEALARRSTDRVELIINGDMVDFLAEKIAEKEAQDDSPADWVPFTSNGEAACAKLQAIADRDPQFFKALGTLLDKNHRLTILTGNHDVELALPPVRQRLKKIIGVRPDHDYELIYNGEAYVVGDALIEHGNRYDRWNVVDYDSLRRISSLMSRRQRVPKNYEFDPPAGSKMVSWVMNPIKDQYKFIDLLKPERDVAVPLLLALEPGYRQLIGTVAKLRLEARSHRTEGAALPRYAGDINADIDSAPLVLALDMGGLVGEGSAQSSGSQGESALEEILRIRLGGDSRAFQDALPPVEPTTAYLGDISTANLVDRTFGLARLLLSRDDADIGRRLPALLMALRALQPDRSFDEDYETGAEYTDAANALFDGGFRFVLFGHTHMAKKIELRPGCWYLNSGTWADLIRLPREIITAAPHEASEKLEAFVQHMSMGLLPPWIVFRPTYLQLDLDAGDHVISAELAHYERAATAS